MHSACRQSIGRCRPMTATLFEKMSPTSSLSGLTASRSSCTHGLSFSCINSADSIRAVNPFQKLQLIDSPRLYHAGNRDDPFGSLHNCQHIDEVLRIAVDNLNSATTSNTAAVWFALSRLLTSRQRPMMGNAAQRTTYEQQISAILDHTTNLMDKFTPKQLATIILAIAKIVRCIREDHLRKRANIHQLAFGKIFKENNTNPKQSIFRALSEAADEKVAKFEPRYLSNFAYALALMKYNPKFDDRRSLLESIGDASIDCIEKFNDQDISNLVWSYATLTVPQPFLFQTVGNTLASMPDLKSFRPQNLSNIVWAFAALKVRHHEMFTTIGDSIVASDNLKLFKPQELSNTVWAYAVLNIQHPGLFEKIGDSIVASGILKFFNSQDLSIIAWSYAVANVSTPMLFSESFSVALLNKQNEFSVENLRQLHQWHIWQEAELSNVGLPESLRKRCQQAFIQNDYKFSYLENDVLSVLDDMGLSPINEYLTQSSYRLDALVEINGKKVGVEVNGSYHFIDRVPNGSTTLKHRHITKVDAIPLVSVPFWEWNALGKDRDQKKQYLQLLLASNAAAETLQQPSEGSSEVLANDYVSHQDVSSEKEDTSTKLEADYLETLTVPQLKDILRSKGLKVGGRKIELIERLTAME